MSYLIKKDNKTNEIIFMEYNLSGYEFSPGEKTKKNLKIDHITIINPELIQKVLNLKFKKIFKKITLNVYQIIQDEDASESDTSLILDEISRLKELIKKTYHKYISLEKEKEFLLKLEYLEKELRYKEILINEKSYTLEENKGMKK